MKKIFLSLMITSAMICLCMQVKAQKQTEAKPPAPNGPVLQADAETKKPAPAADTKLQETAGKKSSFEGPLPVKGIDPAVSLQAPEQKPLPETDKLVPPKTIKNR